MSNILHCPECGAACKQVISQNNEVKLEAFSIIEAEKKIEQLKQALEKLIENKKNDQKLIDELKSNIRLLQSAD